MIKLTTALLRGGFPRAPAAVVDAFVARQSVLAKAGILDSPMRLAYLLANIDHETAGFSIAGLTENIKYTAARMAQVWPNRFTSAAAVINRYGSAPGWQSRAFDDIYGNRMGNRPGTSDGSAYIGRGGPQITGRDGYAEVGKRAGLDLAGNPALACQPEHQPDIAAAFWSWKGLNRLADAGDFTACVKAWNGGTNGLADRQVQLAKWKRLIAGAPVQTAPAAPCAAPTPTPAPAVPLGFWAKLAALFKRAA